MPKIKIKCYVKTYLYLPYNYVDIYIIYMQYYCKFKYLKSLISTLWNTGFLFDTEYFIVSKQEVKIQYNQGLQKLKRRVKQLHS